MKYLAPFSLFFLVACGPLIDNGVYSVHLIVEETNDPFYEVGKESDVDWDIRENDGKYKLKIIGNDTVFDGKEKGEAIEFEKYQDLGSKPNCPIDNSLSLRLVPSDNGFIGEAKQVLRMCWFYDTKTASGIGTEWITKMYVRGKKKGLK